jgi:hypothetical protein
LSWRRELDLSRSMTTLQFDILYCNSALWLYLLGLLALFIGTILVAPDPEATLAELYAVAREKAWRAASHRRTKLPASADSPARGFAHNGARGFSSRRPQPSTKCPLCFNRSRRRARGNGIAPSVRTLVRYPYLWSVPAGNSRECQAHADPFYRIEKTAGFFDALGRRGLSIGRPPLLPAPRRPPAGAAAASGEAAAPAKAAKPPPERAAAERATGRRAIKAASAKDAKPDRTDGTAAPGPRPRRRRGPNRLPPSQPPEMPGRQPSRRARRQR